jgi:hypothetical protein
VACARQDQRRQQEEVDELVEQREQEQAEEEDQEEEEEERRRRQEEEDGRTRVLLLSMTLLLCRQCTHCTVQQDQLYWESVLVSGFGCLCIMFMLSLKNQSFQPRSATDSQPPSALGLLASSREFSRFSAFCDRGDYVKFLTGTTVVPELIPSAVSLSLVPLRCLAALAGSRTFWLGLRKFRFVASCKLRISTEF